MKKLYRAEVSWTVSAVMEVEAESMEQALAILDAAALPTETEYCEDSFSVDLIQSMGEVKNEQESFSSRLSFGNYGYTVEGEVLRFNLLNEFPQYKEEVLKADNTDVYYADGYCAEVGYSGDYQLESAELYYIGEDNFVPVRLMTKDELEQIQFFLNEELRLGKEIKHW